MHVVLGIVFKEYINMVSTGIPDSSYYVYISDLGLSNEKVK